jgi:hypothetical protein
VIPIWRRFVARHPGVSAWALLSVAMVAVIFITSLGARPGALQLLFLALVGVLLSGATVLLLRWEPEESDEESGSEA